MVSNEIMVSIKCITYNHGKFIRKALDSFLMQKVNFRYEIVVHDDASTDNTADIIREYERKYPDIVKPIYQTENQYSKGSNVLRQCIDSHLRGKYTAYCEGDDYWTDPNKLQMQVDYLEEHPECAFSFHNADVVWIDEHKVKVFLPDNTLKNIVWKNQDMVLNAGQLVELGFIPTASIVARTDLVKLIVPFCENQVCGDLPLRLFLSMHGDAFYINKIMSAYRIGNVNSASGQASSSNEKMLKTVEGHVKILEGFNKQSNYIWNKEVQHDISRRKIRYCVTYNDKKMLTDEEFNYLYKKEVSFCTKVKYCINTYMGEKLYLGIKGFYHKFKKMK